MKYINMGTPDYEVYVPADKFPVVIGTNESEINEQGQPVVLRSRLCYPDSVFRSPLMPKEVVKRFEAEDSKVPGLNYD